LVVYSAIDQCQDSEVLGRDLEDRLELGEVGVRRRLVQEVSEGDRAARLGIRLVAIGVIELL
jgi:hypothetical protein